MSVTRSIGSACAVVLRGIVKALLGTKVHPNVLTAMGLVISICAAWYLHKGEFFLAGWIMLFGAMADLLDGPVARASNRVTRFGGFFDSVLDRYTDLILLMGMLVYYASIDRFFYVVLTAVAMTGSVLISYTRARSENVIDSCKVGFLERPERMVLMLIGAFFGKMAPVIWVIAVLSNITVAHRITHTWSKTRPLDRDQPLPQPSASVAPISATRASAAMSAD